MYLLCYVMLCCVMLSNVEFFDDAEHFISSEECSFVLFSLFVLADALSAFIFTSITQR